MQAVWHGEMQLITDLDRVFEQGEDKNIDVVKREVRQYEKEIKERGAAIVNQERTKAEKEKSQKTKAPKSRMTEKGLAGSSAILQAPFHRED